MANTRVKLMQSGLRTMHTLGMHHVLRPFSEGLGLIFTMHRVRPATQLQAQLGAFPDFNPNGLLEISPDFLDATLEALKAQGLALISMDEAVEALKNPVIRKGRFAVLSLDDGYKDNRDHALPVLEAHDAPAIVYVPSDYPQGLGELWWVALEQMIRQADTLARPDKPGEAPVSVRTDAEKLDFYLDLYWALRAFSQDEQRALVWDMCKAQGYDMLALCRDLVLPTDEFLGFAKHPLITIGAHTESHRAIARLSKEQAMDEIVGGADWLEEQLGHRPEHFSFPYGDPGSAGPRDYEFAREAGFTSAVTTRKGMLYPEHGDHLFGLPRVSLNGDYQNQMYVELFTSGAPFLLANRFRKVA
ncbi:MAG: polysaccharide deacetylase family protein [Hyphomicrobiales bacterium]